jgi:hypothetical protein
MRIFVLGDSFAENLFKEAYKSVEFKIEGHEQIMNYVSKLNEHGIDKALWFTDWLEKWGYEVINLGKGGACNEDIYYQFNEIDDFREGDRLIVWWTSINRFLWFRDNGETWVKGHSIHEGGQEYFVEQAIRRAHSLDINDGYANKKIIPFIKYLTNINSKYKPIITSFCPLILEKISDNPYFFSFISNSPYLNIDRKWFESIKKETKTLIDDGHNGRKTNYLCAMVIDEILKSNLDGEYTKNFKLTQKIKNRVLSSDVLFKKLPEWE